MPLGEMPLGTMYKLFVTINRNSKHSVVFVHQKAALTANHTRDAEKKTGEPAAYERDLYPTLSAPKIWMVSVQWVKVAAIKED